MGTVDDRHSRPTTTLAADELRRLVQEEEPSRLPRSSDAIRRERIDTPTTEMSAIAINELLATEPRTSPAVVPREMRHDTVTDPGAKPTSALDAQTVAELAAAVPVAAPIARPALPRGRSVRLAFVIAGIAALALLAITLLR